MDMGTTVFQCISYEVSDRVASLRLVAGGEGLLAELRAAVAAAQADRDVRVVVVSGGAETFLEEAAPQPSNGDAVAQVFARMEGTEADALLNLDKPTIASISGLATGTGSDIAIGCDIRIGGSNARIGVTGLRRGWVSGPSVYLLPRIVGLGKANELLFTADIIDAAEAGRIGFLDEVHPADELEAATARLAQRIANGPPVATRFTKRAIYRGLSSTADVAKEYTTLSRSLGMQLTNETREGFDSFNEKRAPSF
jgi:enoyl-CoA hydratase/carnithine racemase